MKVSERVASLTDRERQELLFELLEFRSHVQPIEDPKKSGAVVSGE